MKLTKISIDNFRNLNEIKINLDERINYIVGENNIGKSNFVYALSKVFGAGTFSESDFFNAIKPIVIEFTMLLSDDEIGIFDELCDPLTPNQINIVAAQESPDDYIMFSHKESGTPLQASLIRRINLLHYDSMRSQLSDLSFSKQKGPGALLNFVLQKYIHDKEPTFITEDLSTELQEYTQTVFDRIRSLKKYGIHTQIVGNSIDLLSKIIVLEDNNSISITDSGCGIQFSTLIVLSLFSKIINEYKNTQKKGEVLSNFQSLLVFDEPEVHLHPFAQRNIIFDLLKITSNKDEAFLNLIEELFGIKSFEGQIIVVTHSPNIITENYEQIVRFYKENDKTKVVCGKNIDLGNEKKQLYILFPFVKEAIFSKSAIVVEGDSEYACIPAFAEKLGTRLDEQGILVIKAGGAESIIPLMNLLEKFCIPAVGIPDKDKMKPAWALRPDVFCTTTKCFESEIMQVLSEKEKLQTIINIVETYDSKKTDRELQADAINKRINNYEMSFPLVSKSYKLKEASVQTDLFTVLYTTWLDINKGIILGKLIGESLSKDEIPSCYQKAIKKAIEFSAR